MAGGAENIVAIAPTLHDLARDRERKGVDRLRAALLSTLRAAGLGRRTRLRAGLAALALATALRGRRLRASLPTGQVGIARRAAALATYLRAAGLRRRPRL